MVSYLECYKLEFHYGKFMAISTTKNKNINNLSKIGLHNLYFDSNYVRETNCISAPMQRVIKRTDSLAQKETKEAY